MVERDALVLTHVSMCLMCSWGSDWLPWERKEEQAMGGGRTEKDEVRLIYIRLRD